MRRDELSDLSAFTVVAAEGSFTRAAARLGMSQSALSHAIKSLEQRLGIRLLSRTTRSVATTEAGEALLQSLRPAFEDIDAALAMLSSSRDTPAGTVRLTMIKRAALSVVRPMLPSFLTAHPDVRVELKIDDGLVDIVRDRFDAGIRFGEQIAKDMISVRVGPDLRAAVVASPAYLSTHSTPLTPRDLTQHRCINYRMASAGGLYPWAFAKNGRAIDVRVDGPLTFNDGDLIEAAALDGQGIGYLYEDQVLTHLAAGRLVRMLEPWCSPIAGYHLYYPSRRLTPPAMAALIEALRYKEIA